MAILWSVFALDIQIFIEADVWPFCGHSQPFPFYIEADVSPFIGQYQP